MLLQWVIERQKLRKNKDDGEEEIKKKKIMNDTKYAYWVYESLFVRTLSREEPGES